MMKPEVKLGGVKGVLAVDAVVARGVTMDVSAGLGLENLESCGGLNDGCSLFVAARDSCFVDVWVAKFSLLILHWQIFFIENLEGANVMAMERRLKCLCEYVACIVFGSYSTNA